MPKKTIASKDPEDPVLLTCELPSGRTASIALPTEEQMVNMGLLLLAFPERLTGEQMSWVARLMGWTTNSKYKMETIAPFVRRLLFRREVKWKKFGATQADRRLNRQLINRFKEDGEIQA